MYQISELIIYPIKSLGGISVTQSLVEKRGLQYDRRWMLCNENNEFITQREWKELALFKLSFATNSFIVSYKKESGFVVPFSIAGKTEKVKIWDDNCKAIEYKIGSDWFSKMLHFKCKLFYMPNQTERKVGLEYAIDNEITSFSDAFPILLIGQESLNDLNNKLIKKIPMNRFRPNIVMSGGKPFDEDNFLFFNIGNNQFKRAKPCARCVITTINQSTAIAGKEPLKTLSTYRNFDNNILFGQNIMVLQSNFEIAVGDLISI